MTYENIKAFIYDVRARKEWANTADQGTVQAGKFMLTSSGDGTISTELGEECDPTARPVIADENNVPINYDENPTNPSDVYPDSDYGALWKAGGKVAWVAANTQLDRSGNTERTSEYLPEGYY